MFEEKVYPSFVFHSGVVDSIHLKNSFYLNRNRKICRKGVSDNPQTSMCACGLGDFEKVLFIYCVSCERAHYRVCMGFFKAPRSKNVILLS